MGFSFAKRLYKKDFLKGKKNTVGAPVFWHEMMARHNSVWFSKDQMHVQISNCCCQGQFLLFSGHTKTQIFFDNMKQVSCLHGC